MRKLELIKVICEQADLSSHQADDALAAMIDHITNGLVRDKKFTLIGFGTFSVKARAARTGRNPKTGEPIEIAAVNTVSFKAGSKLKETVNA